MIVVHKIPEKTITYHPGTITLDQVYKIVVIKTSNGVQGFEVQVMEANLDESKIQLIKDSVIANLNKESVSWV